MYALNQIPSELLTNLKNFSIIFCSLLIKLKPDATYRGGTDDRQNADRPCFVLDSQPAARGNDGDAVRHWRWFVCQPQPRTNDLSTGHRCRCVHSQQSGHLRGDPP